MAATRSFCPIVADKQSTLVGICNHEPHYKECKHKVFNEVIRCPVITDFKEYHRPLENVTASGFIYPENVSCSLGLRKIKTLYSNASSHQQIFLIYPYVDQVITLYFVSRRLNTIEVGAS